MFEMWVYFSDIVDVIEWCKQFSKHDRAEITCFTEGLQIYTGSKHCCDSSSILLDSVSMLIDVCFRLNVS